MKNIFFQILMSATLTMFGQSQPPSFASVPFTEMGITLTQVGEDYFRYDCNGPDQSKDLLNFLGSISVQYMQMPPGIVQDLVIGREYHFDNEWIVIYLLMDQNENSPLRYSSNYNGVGQVAVGCLRKLGAIVSDKE